MMMMMMMMMMMSAFHWDDPDQDQCSEIIQIIARHRNQQIHRGKGYIGSFDVPWVESESNLSDLRSLIQILVIPKEHTLW